MNDDIKLELAFATPNSYIFNSRPTGKDIEVHVHIGQYHVIHITIIISDRGILLQKDRRFLTYIDKLMLELDMILGNFFGFLVNGYEAETYFHINFNSIRISFPPCFLRDSDEHYQNVKHNLSKIIYDKIKSIKPNEIY